MFAEVELREELGEVVGRILFGSDVFRVNFFAFIVSVQPLFLDSNVSRSLLACRVFPHPNGRLIVKLYDGGLFEFPADLFEQLSDPKDGDGRVTTSPVLSLGGRERLGLLNT